jgi:hypothetical protein
MSLVTEAMNMFDQILGLPAHPLIIHAAVVLTPLLVALSIAYAVLPRFRPKLGWAVVLTALGAPVAVFAARESGEAFERRIFTGEVPEIVKQHESLSLPLLLTTVGLAIAALALVYLTRPRRDSDSAGGTARIPGTILSVVIVVLAVVVGYYVVRAGHTGATAVWG